MDLITFSHVRKSDPQKKKTNICVAVLRRPDAVDSQFPTPLSITAAHPPMGHIWTAHRSNNENWAILAQTCWWTTQQLLTLAPSVKLAWTYQM